MVYNVLLTPILIILYIPLWTLASVRYAPKTQSLLYTTPESWSTISTRSLFPVDHTPSGRLIPGQPGNSSCCGFTNPAVTKIIGGSETAANEFPWAVGLVRSGGSRPFCGGSIINNHYILSAAHCLVGRTASSLQVLIGEHDLTTNSNTEIRAEVDAVIVHPYYSKLLLFNDFGLLRLQVPLVFNRASNRVAPVCLPLRKLYLRQNSVTVGWGVIDAFGRLASRLQKVSLTTMSNVECSLLYPLMVWPSMVCAIGDLLGGRDSCAGDSGGGLMVQQGLQQMIVGVTSWGFGCAQALRPGVYARVTNVLDWIITNTQDATYC